MIFASEEFLQAFDRLSDAVGMPLAIWGLITIAAAFAYDAIGRYRGREKRR